VRKEIWVFWICVEGYLGCFLRDRSEARATEKQLPRSQERPVGKLPVIVVAHSFNFEKRWNSSSTDQ
jgi:hypothetical protein